jgi:hypothetical protein
MTQITGKIARKYMAHFLDASFMGTTPVLYRLGSDLEAFNVELNPSTEQRQNILGEYVLRETQEQNFVFASRDPYGGEFQQNLDNLGVMQDVSAWIIDRNNARDFPEWEGGEVVAIVPTISGYPIAMGSAFARYQIQIKVTYRVTERM